MLQSKAEYISEIEDAVKSLQALLPEFEKLERRGTNVMLSHYFADRAVKIGTAVLRILDLDVPLAILCRVLCEDFISLYWVSQSSQNADAYTKRSLRELGKRGTILLSRLIEDKKRKGESVAGINVEPFRKMTPKGKSETVSDMAKELGLDALYDYVYRGTSSDIHAHEWGTFRKKIANEDLLVLSYLSNFLLLMVGVFSQGTQVVSPKVILEYFELG
jgi:hypothetical protein